VLRFLVKDTGIGIPADKQRLLFQKFSQADSSTTRKYGGTGLGLAISKQLAEMMGGEIGVISEDGHGSEFWFTVRMGKQLVGAQPTKLSPAGFRGSPVLVVDDNATSRHILTDQLKAWGLRTEASPDGASALAALKNARDAGTPFLAAILDMQMPGMDGIVLASTIHADETLKDTRLILMTTLGGPPIDVRRMLALGFAADLAKPVRWSELLDTLCAVLTGKEAVQPILPNIKRGAIGALRRSPLRVLLVEDNTTNQLVGVGLLKKLGLKVDVAANGAEAVRALENLPYDLVLMDCQMPVMDGYDATRQIRNPESNVHNHRIPIIAMTANTMQGDREKCLVAGMNDYVPKPVSPRVLAEVLNKWLPGESEAPPLQAICKPADCARQPEGKTEPQVFDLAGLMAMVMHDEDFALAVVQDFLSALPGQIEALSGQLVAGDGPAAAHHAHSIKGMSANVGGEALRAVAFEMEKAVKAGWLEDAASRLPELETQFDLLRAAIKTQFKTY